MNPSESSDSPPPADHAFEQELTAFIVEALILKDIEPQAISPTAPLFGAGLGLDSIDALELAVALTKQYQVQLPNDDAETRRVFASVRSLAEYVRAQRSHPGAGGERGGADSRDPETDAEPASAPDTGNA